MNVLEYLEKNKVEIKRQSGGEIRIGCYSCSGNNMDVNSDDGRFYCWNCGVGGYFPKLQEHIGDLEKVDLTETEDIEEKAISVDPTEIFRYQQKLHEHESLLKWLHEKKGISDSNIVKYQIGWSGRSITFPIKNKRGDYINIKFRGDPTRPGSGKSVWQLKGGKSALFNAEVLSTAKRVVICEGEWDAIYLSQLGIDAVTGTSGAMGFQERWVNLFNRNQEIFICYDQEANETGDRGMNRTKEMFTKHGIHANIVKLPRTYQDKVDISDYFLELGHTKEDFEKLLSESVVDDPRSELERRIKEWSSENTDTGNAYKIIGLYGDKIRYDILRNRWLVWKGHRWVQDYGGGTAHYYAIKMAKHYQHLAIDIEGGEGKSALKYARSLENKNKIIAATDILKVLEPVRDNGEKWDINNWILGCENGVVDLKTGELRDGNPSDYVTMCANFKFDKSADCPMWRKFLSEIFMGEEDLIHYIHKALGYSITGDTSSQAAFICYGVGANGKSVLFKTIADILGDYAHNAPTALFQKNKYANAGAATPEIAATEFKRFVVSSETLAEGTINEERIKKWTGGDKENARFLHDNGHEFQPTMKPWLFVNHQPRATDESYGFWRRIKMIPFERVFKPNEQDHLLLEKLSSEKSGIFNWLLEGCLMWQKEGLLPEPEKVTVATEEYKEENNILAEYISDRIDISSGESTYAKDIYKDYKAWAEDQGFSSRETFTNTRFFREFSKNFLKNKSNKEARNYIGLKLKSGIGLVPKQQAMLGERFAPLGGNGLRLNSNNSSSRDNLQGENMKINTKPFPPDEQTVPPLSENENEIDQTITAKELNELFGLKD